MRGHLAENAFGAKTSLRGVNCYQPGVNWKPLGNARDMAQWHPNAILNGLGDPDFNQFVRNVIKVRPGYVTEMYGWYTTPVVDFVGRQESLREDLLAVLKRQELDFDERLILDSEAVGVSHAPRAKVDWDPALRQQVCHLEHVALVRYGYEFSETPASNAAV